MRAPVIQEVEAVVPLGRPEIRLQIRELHLTKPKDIYGVNGAGLCPLTDAGAGEVIEAADQAVLPQKGEALVLLGLDVVSGPVEGLAENSLF